MIITLLLCVLAVMAVTQPTSVRRNTALLYVIPTVAFALGSPDMSDKWYYIGAALTDLFTIILISFIVPLTRLSLSLIAIATLSVIGNLVGMLLWYMSVPAMAYNMFFLALYVGALAALYEKDGTHVGMGGIFGRVLSQYGDGDSIPRTTVKGGEKV